MYNMQLVIDELIESSGLKHEFIAKKIGVSSRTLYSWRKGKTFPKLDKAIKLADVLGVEITELYNKE